MIVVQGDESCLKVAREEQKFPRVCSRTNGVRGELAMGLKDYIKEGIKEIDEDDKPSPAPPNADKTPPAPLPTEEPALPRD
jgi:hypothetical protein